MPFMPVAAREVRAASRQARTYAWRAGTAAVAFGVMAVILWIMQYDSGPAPGRILFGGVSTAAFIYCLIAGAVRTADAISSEKRDNTLGLLLLTDLKGWDILVGKLLSTALNSFVGLLALFPMLAVPMLLGGVQWSEFGKMALNLINTLFFAISVGLLVSTLVRQSVVAISLSLVAMLIAGAGIPLLSTYVEQELHSNDLSELIFLFSPVHDHLFSFATNSRPNSNAHYWWSLGILFLWGCFNLRFAVYLLPRCWQDVPKNKKSERWQERARAWRFGSGQRKNRFRKKLLDQSPLYWLANREQVSSFMLMIFAMAVLLASFAAGMMNYYNTWNLFRAWILGLALVHATIAFRMSMAVTQRLAEDRRSGALELLLGTEISVREILRGQWLAFGRQFFGPAMIVLFGGFFGLALALLGLAEDMQLNGRILETVIEMFARVFRKGANADEAALLFVFVSIQVWLALSWIGVIWAGMWLGLRERRTGVAMWAVLVMLYPLPWFFLLGLFATAGGAGLLEGISGSKMFGVVTTTAWIIGLTNLGLICWWARRNLHARFRETAADRYMARREFDWTRARRWGVRLVAGGATLIALYAGFRAYVNQRGETAWQATRAAHPDFPLEPTPQLGAPVPDDQNLANARLVREAAASSANRNGTPRISWDLNGWSGPLPWKWTETLRTDLDTVRSQYLDRVNPKLAGAPLKLPALTALVMQETNGVKAAAAEIVLAVLSRFTNDFAELHADAKARPRTRFEPIRSWEITYSLGLGGPRRQTALMWANFNNGQQEGVRAIGIALALRTAARLAAEERGSTSLEDIFLAHRLAEGFADLPDSAQRCFDMILDQTQPIYDGLTLHKWSDAQLTQIQDFYARIDLWKNCDVIRKNYVAMRFAEIEQVVDYRSGKTAYDGWWLARQAPTGFLRQKQAALMEWGERDLKGVFLPETRTIDLFQMRRAQGSDPYFSGPRGGNDPFFMITRSLSFTQTTIDQIIVACALERFRNARGEFPKALEELVPAYLAKIPNDVYTGQPLHYRRAIRGAFKLYGVASDGIDNGGAPQPINNVWSFWNETSGSDWVWNSDAPDESPEAKRRRK